jgi:uncharacterized protein
LLKESFIDDWGKRFVEAGMAVLLYDHRSWGSSDGTPRNEVDPHQQAEDYHDAVLFVQSIPQIDPKRVAIWGIGHSGGASMIAAGDDPNIKAVVLVMPALSGSYDAAGWPEGLLEKAWEERRAVVTGKKLASDLEYVKVWDDTEAEAKGERNGILLHGDLPWTFISQAIPRSKEAGTPWDNRMSLRSLINLRRAEPQDHIHKISPKPLLQIGAIDDPLSGAVDKQKKAFEMAGEPKTFVTLQDSHLNNYFRNWENTMIAQLKWLKKTL